MFVFWVLMLCGLAALKMEAVYFSKTLVSTWKSKLRYNPEEQHRHFHRRENLKSDKFLVVNHLKSG
jgi:hypothetical protein